MHIEDSLYKYLTLYKYSPDFFKKLIGKVFNIIPREKRLGKEYDYYASVASIYDRPEISKEQIDFFQYTCIKDLLKHCFENVPHYREKWNKYGIDINQIKDLDDFKKKIPLTHRDEVQTNPESFLAQNYSKKNILKMNTGGSTGTPLTLYYLKGVSRAAEWAHMWTMWKRIGFDIGDRGATLRGDYIGKNKIYTYDPLRNILVMSSFALNRETIRDYVRALEEFKPKYINAYAASLYSFVQLCKDSGININPIDSLELILLGSENILDWQISLFSTFFGCRIFYWYGHGEQTCLAGGCENSDLYHFMPSYGYNELNNENKRGLSEYEIIGTSFVNPLMPLVRYCTQDFGVAASENCSCGRKVFQLSRITGREQEVAIGLKGEKITLTALIFGRHAHYFHNIIKMQIINYKPGYLLIKVVPKKSFSSRDQQEIISTLSKEQGMPFSVQIELVKEIESTGRGKQQFLIRTFDDG